MDDILIIPDVHGRTFWKEDLKHDLIIFLGDYLDPYPDEGITNEQALENFKEILRFKEENKDKVILLLGNHDLQYVSHIITTDRVDKKNYKEISRLFTTNNNFFKVVHYLKYKDKNVVFSHAPITDGWVKCVNYLHPTLPEGDFVALLDKLNELWRNFMYGSPVLFGALSYCSYYRGGADAYGSPIWADVREAQETADWYQIFGHTQLKDAYISATFADLDCRKCFKINHVLK